MKKVSNCDYCGCRRETAQYEISGVVNGVEKTASVRLCLDCDAMGVLAPDYDLCRRIEEMTGILFDEETIVV